MPTSLFSAFRQAGYRPTELVLLLELREALFELFEAIEDFVELARDIAASGRRWRAIEDHASVAFAGAMTFDVV
jgi:hypothetical protein